MEESNFNFLEKHNPLFFQLGVVAELNFAMDPNTTLMKLRQLGEAIAQEVAARIGLSFYDVPSQIDLLNRLNREMEIDETVMDLFHSLRKEGNRAVHNFQTMHKEAIQGLKVARELALWYYRSFEDLHFRATSFIAPQDPSKELQDLQTQIQLLTSKLDETNEKLEDNQNLAELLTQEKEQFQVLIVQMDSEVKVYQELAQEQENALLSHKQEFEKVLEQVREEVNKNKKNTRSIKNDIRKAAQQIELSEELTRVIIDIKLNDLGWEADSQDLRFSKGARPERGKNKAISEWPTRFRQSADYVLFVGLSPVAVVEAKKENKDVSGKIGQAERYSKGFIFQDYMGKPWTLSGEFSPWNDGSDSPYQIPFVFSCNGRPYVKQLEEKSGVWFRDVRKTCNTKKALHDFYSPSGLIDLLKRDKEESERKLRSEGFFYLGLRDYQEKAIEKIEEALVSGKKECLVAMATGTGKTRTIIGLMYRMLKAERFKRILFLVDRNSLGIQALDNINDVLLEQNLPLSKIYNIAELRDMVVEAETRIQVATVQSMVKRIFYSENTVPVDTYDCIIVDEAHRGYTLDQEMSEGELEVRDQAQYLSTYRRALEYFDSSLIGLTATPAKHTTEIFGKPVFTYSYREAVAEDWLIDHEPPVRYVTELAEHGIHFSKGEVSVIDRETGKVESAMLEDELDFEVESFNRRVITESFNKVVCEQLAKEIIPYSDEKTLIFCVNNLHADMVARLLGDEFRELYGDDYNEAAVKKITGESDNVAQLIKQFKNEKYPSVAITVDLLTTGIDVPQICHLVFMRRVKSRILYEQMIGRATRRCDEIGKTVFKIYDPVDIYKSLEKVSTMKPLVKNPNISLSQLLEELKDSNSYKPLDSDMGRTHADDVLDDVAQRVMRVFRQAEKKAEKNPQLKNRLEELKDLWGIDPKVLHKHLHQLGPKEAITYIQNTTNLLEQVDEVKRIIGTERYPLISHKSDNLKERTQKYGDFDKPEDYLDSFNNFVKNHINESVALSVIVKSPKDMTREQLREVRLLLDDEGFSETKVKTAWKNKTHVDIAASIVGYIRQAALGEDLIPFDQRVSNAMNMIYTSRDWLPFQKKWLEHIAKQLTHEIVLDKQFVHSVFSDVGGYKKIDKILDNQLDVILSELSDTLWGSA